VVAWPKVKTQVWPIEPDIFTFEEMSLAMQKLFWIDLEMTGLNVENEVIIEVGAVITDLKMNSLENYHALPRPKL
jgi:DNA polymerase III epsilon subunit-like protein